MHFPVHKKILSPSDYVLQRNSYMSKMKTSLVENNIAAYQKTLEFYSQVQQGNTDDALKTTIPIARQLAENPRDRCSKAAGRSSAVFSRTSCRITKLIKFIIGKPYRVSTTPIKGPIHDGWSRNRKSLDYSARRY